jgi:hypothetical protein
VSVTITFTDTNGAHDYSYSAVIPVEANCKTEITATYKAGSAEISGSIQCRDWKDEHQVTIEFGEGSSNVENSNNEALTQGDVYKNCYILDVLKESAEQSTLLLMAPKGGSDMTIEKAIDNKPGSYTFEGFTNWRLLTIDEAKDLYTICSQGLEELNSLLTTSIQLDRNYFCMDDDSNQTFYYFSMGASEFKTVEAKSDEKYYTRFVKEVTVKWVTESGK